METFVKDFFSTPILLLLLLLLDNKTLATE